MKHHTIVAPDLIMHFSQGIAFGDDHEQLAQDRMSQKNYDIRHKVKEVIGRLRKSPSSRNMNGTASSETKKSTRSRSKQRQMDQSSTGNHVNHADPIPATSNHGRSSNSRRGRSGSQRSNLSSRSLKTRERQAAASLARNLEATPNAAAYAQARSQLLDDEQKKSWDIDARSKARPEEFEAQKIVAKIREDERRNLFGDLPSEAVPDPDSRDMGGRFLANKEKIDQSKIFHISKQIPKGSHLHLHFNSEIMPEVLFPHARAPEMMNTMFIRSTRPLILATPQSFLDAEIVFNVFPAETPSADIFSPTYNPNVKDPTNCPWMLWREFRANFPLRPAPVDSTEDELDSAERWARQKMIISVEQAYGATETHNSAWACFNQGTRAFKGLVAYEGVYRWYIGAVIDSMIADKIMYAELRPMLLDKSIPSNDGTRKLDHKEQMNIICEEVEKKLNHLEETHQIDKFPYGLKIIYCTPRSIPREKMKLELDDCLKLKLQFPELICGFDLVGAEDRPNNVGFYADQLLAFQEACADMKVDVPFMFHAGETLIDTGGSSNPENSNLYDSLLLKAKRIGHGYALLKHPLLVEKYKKQKICLELCPISNELLHLCGNAREHPYPQLLAAGLHCTLNADNPSLFSSSLSYEFYQVMVGDPRMTIHGWKQLAEWSIEHSCLTDAEITRAKAIHDREWQAFCKWVIDEYAAYAATLPELS